MTVHKRGLIVDHVEQTIAVRIPVIRTVPPHGVNRIGVLEGRCPAVAPRQYLEGAPVQSSRF